MTVLLGLGGSCAGISGFHKLTSSKTASLKYPVFSQQQKKVFLIFPSCPWFRKSLFKRNNFDKNFKNWGNKYKPCLLVRFFCSKSSLICFMPIVSFYTPWKQKTSGIERPVSWNCWNGTSPPKQFFLQKILFKCTFSGPATKVRLVGLFIYGFDHALVCWLHPENHTVFYKSSREKCNKSFKFW